VPQNLLKYVIGLKGKNLNDIRKASLCEIKVPTKTTSEDNETSDELIPVSIIGDQEGISAAKGLIQEIIAEKVTFHCFALIK
jgi:rRNA processing protein Krr1/Pno1